MKFAQGSLGLTPGLVAEAVARIVRACQPCAIIAFGSRARGQAEIDSDLDLLVLLEVAPDEPRAVRRRLREELADLDFSKDILVSDRERFAVQSTEVNSVYRDVMHEGVFLWHNGSAPCSRVLKPCAATVCMLPGTRVLCDRAADDELVLRLAGIPEIPFRQHVQGAVEKLLKALINEHGERYPRTHDLKELEEKLNSLSEFLPAVPVALGDLSDFALDLRYEDAPLPLDRVACIETVERIRNYVQESIEKLSRR